FLGWVSAHGGGPGAATSLRCGGAFVPRTWPEIERSCGQRRRCRLPAARWSAKGAAVKMTCTKATTRGLSLDLNSPFSPHVSDLRSPEDINLNLYNFDKVDALNCPYVLTSPRSLEACANLGIKPVELLSKSFEEFRDELPSYTPFEEVKHLYKLFEIQRTRQKYQDQADT
ncbi:hypothetical protein BIW11_08390, partial [Tropilaelaps mercedesae]